MGERCGTAASYPHRFARPRGKSSKWTLSVAYGAPKLRGTGRAANIILEEGVAIRAVASKRAHQELIERHASWDRISDRLDKFPAIRAAFPIRRLKAASSAAPYRSHYMTLRLSEWPDPVSFFHAPFFNRFDTLLECAAGIDGWKKEQSVLRDHDYGAFWSLLWQLQVMEWLLSLGSRLRWNGTGPDLTASVADEILHVECTVVRGRSPQREYIDDLLTLIDPTLRLGSAIFPNGASALDAQFDALVRDVEHWWPAAHESASTDVFGTPILELRRERYSVRSVPSDGPRPIFPGDSVFVKDDPNYPSTELERALSGKQGKNRSIEPAPTVLAVNFLLNRDFQRSLFIGRGEGPQLKPPDWPEFDAVLVSTCGIDRPLRDSYARFVRASERIPRKVCRSLEKTES